METRIEQLKCGQCGQELHKLYIRPNGEVIAQCIECKSESEIVIISKPKISIRNNNGSGTLCIL